MINKYFVLTILLTMLLSTSSFPQEEEENPHEEMLEDQFVCLDCHTKVPEKGETSSDYFLFDLPSENCLGCHDETEHAGTKEHEGEEAKPLLGDENGKIACFSCHDPHPEGAIEGRTVYNAQLNERSREFIRLVLLPYLEESIDKDLKLDRKENVYLRYPIEDNQLCNKCHKELNKTSWRRYTTWEKFMRLFSY